MAALLKFRQLALVCLGSLIIPLPALADYPIIFNHAKRIDMRQSACERRAEIVMKNEGFTEDFEPIGLGAFGVNGNYSASIRCEARLGIVFFAVAGPENKTTSRLASRLQSAF